MIEGQNYKQFISQQNLLEQNIAEGWGYQLTPQQYLIKKQKIINNVKIAKIKPLKNNISYVSKELQKVDQEIKQMKIQKQMKQTMIKASKDRNKNEAITGQNSNTNNQALKKMYQRIEQYNFIVQHRHIRQKSSDQARKILGIQKKKQSEIILEQIQSLKKLLLCKNTIQKTIQINQQILELYKLYKEQLFKSKQTSERQGATTNHDRISSVSRYTKENKSKVVKETAVQSEQATTNAKDKNRQNSPINKKQLFASMKVDYRNKFSPQIKTIKNRSDKMSLLIKRDVKKSQKHLKTQQNKIQIEDLMIMQQLNQSQQGSTYLLNEFDINNQNSFTNQQRLQAQSLMINHQLFKLKRKTSQYQVRKRMFSITQPKQQEKDMKKNRMLTTITQVYNKKEQLERSKKLDKYLNQSKEVRQIWKHRINQNFLKNQRNYQALNQKLKNTSRKKLTKQLKKKQYQEQIAKIEQQFSVNRKSKILKEKIDILKKNIYDQEKMFSILVKKKISKFRRVPGTNLVQLNDSMNAAKQILGTIKNRQSLEPSTIKRNSNGESYNMFGDPQWMIVQSLNRTYIQSKN